MLEFSPENISERDNYKLLTGSIIPRPVALVSTISDEGVVNLAPFSYFNIVTSNPPIISLAVQRKAGELKDTARNLLSEGSAVIHVVDQDNVADANNTAANLSPHESELELTDFEKVASKTIAAPGVIPSKIRFETELLTRVPIENGGQPSADLFLLSIKHYHISEEVYENGRINAEKLGAISH